MNDFLKELISSPSSWFAAALICLIVEIILPSFLFGAFSIGAMVTTIVAFFVKDVYVLGIVFAASSLLTFVFLRPAYLKMLEAKKDEQKFGYQSLLGKTGMVIESIGVEEPGRLKIDGDEWRALSNGSETVNKGDLAKVVKLEGNTVWVEKQEN
ncbi:MAG TPA: NfeD family protein [Vampirovibrionales bacterium]